MSSQPPTVTCSNPDCRVAETGKCVEGLEVGKCPHFGKSPDAEAEGQVEIDRGLTLRPAERLSAADARVLLREADSRVIAIVGPTGAGKTSLIASLYDLFQDGPVSELMCGRSATLHAFEQACHDARAASLRDTPHSERTPRGDVAFYHLDVVGPGMERRLTLLIGDRAGEEYRSVADDPQAARSLHEVARADTVTLLVDGANLVDSSLRHNVRSELELVVQAFHDAGALHADQPIAVVLTKLDAVLASQFAERAQRDFDGIVASIRRLFGPRSLRAFRVAASPKSTGIVRRGEGVPSLLQFWMAPRQAAVWTLPPSRQPLRAFARLVVIEDSMQ